MTKRARTIVGVLCVVIIAIIAICYASYFHWTVRGDTVLFDASGKWGWGTAPLYSGDGRGGRAVIGVAHNYFFVRDEVASAALMNAIRKSMPAAPSPGPRPGPHAGKAKT